MRKLKNNVDEGEEPRVNMLMDLSIWGKCFEIGKEGGIPMSHH